MVEQGAGHPEPLTCQQHLSSPKSEYRHCLGLHPLLLLLLVTAVTFFGLSLMQQGWGAHHHKGSVVTNAYHHTCCVEHQLRLEQSRLLRQK